MGEDSPRVPAQATPQMGRLRKLPRRVCVGIYLDDAAADRHQEAVEALQRVKGEHALTRFRRVLETQAVTGGGVEPADLTALVDAEDGEDLAELQSAVTAAEAALDEATVWFWFESLGRRRFRELIEAHPATDGQKDRATAAGIKAPPMWNDETFPRILLQESCVSPGLSVQDVDDMFDGDAWNEEEIAALFTAALQANTSSRTVTHRSVPARPAEA